MSTSPICLLGVVFAASRWRSVQAIAEGLGSGGDLPVTPDLAPERVWDLLS